MFLDVFWMFLLHTSHIFWSGCQNQVDPEWHRFYRLGSSFRAMPAPVVEETPGVASCWIHTLMVRGFTLQQLRVAGFELSALRAFGFTPKHWRSWGRAGFAAGLQPGLDLEAQQLWSAWRHTRPPFLGHFTEEFRAKGFTLQDLVEGERFSICRRLNWLLQNWERLALKPSSS